MRIVFMGTGEIGLPVLRALLGSEHQLSGAITQPDKPAGRDQQLRISPIKTALLKTAVPVFQPARIRNEEAIAQLRALAPEVIVVVAYGQILPKAVLEIPPVACLNIHASLLPRHRGAAPIQAAIAAGDRETGITIIYMDEGLDTGDILLQKKIAISPNETGGSLHDRLAQLAPTALTEALDLLVAGNAPRVPQDPARATYAPKLTRDDGKIDWSQPAETIERMIRAYDPWPGAFTHLRDDSGKVRKLKIFRASVRDEETGEPGSISRPNDELIVATGRGALRLEEVQLEGRRRLSAADFLRGFFSPITRF